MKGKEIEMVMMGKILLIIKYTHLEKIKKVNLSANC